MTARLDAYFLLIAILYIVAGIGLGIGMGIAEDFTYMHLHAHINLVGFVMHGFFGFAHRLWPGLSQSALAKPQFLMFTIGAPIFLVGLPVAQFHGQPILAIIGSLLVFAASILFLIMFAAKIRNPAAA